MDGIMMLVRTVAELFVVLALVFGFIKENKVVKTERNAFRVLKALRKRMRAARRRELEQEFTRAEYAGEYRTERRSKPVATETKKRKNNKVA